MLIDGQVDHATGLFMLREHGEPLPLWCTDPVHEDLTQRQSDLRRARTTTAASNGTAIAVDGAAFRDPGVAGLRLRGAAAASKAAAVLAASRAVRVPGDNIGVLVIADSRSGARLFYAPGLGAIDAAVFEAMAAADVRAGRRHLLDRRRDAAPGRVGDKHARDIGHLPQSGAGGMIEWLDAACRGRRAGC